MPINVMSQDLANKIAAGEVVQRPLSVVKELVENSIDAGASRITVEIKQGGITYIRISDNGTGINADEIETAFLRHSTSKMQSEDDLYNISTMGFRGEALASICAVSEVEVNTKTKDAEVGTRVIIQNAKVTYNGIIAINTGTTLIIRDLFRNVPARMKFLKRDSIEAGYIIDIMNRFALVFPDITFKMISDEEEIFMSNGRGNIISAVSSVYGYETSKALLEVQYEESYVKIDGVVGTAKIARGNRGRQSLFVNKRYVKNIAASKIIEDAFRGTIMTGRFPFFVLNVSLPYSSVDVNVHPAKTEVKFADEKFVYNCLYKAVKTTLSASVYIPQPLSEVGDYTPSQQFSEQKNITPNNEQNYLTLQQHNVQCTLLDGISPVRSELSSQSAQPSGLHDMQKAALYQADSPDYSGNAAAQEISHQGTPPVITEIPVKYAGQIFKTYLMFEKGLELILVDQHAAHERIRFVELTEMFERGLGLGQMLLSSIVIETLTASEKRGILSYTEEYTAIGFEIEDFGGNAVIVNQIPIHCDESEIRDLVLKILEILERSGKYGRTELFSKLLYQTACKSAIKANEQLNSREAEEIYQRLENLDNTCPHGRPIKIIITKKDFDKMFKRIV